MARRARIVLLAADGMTNRDIAALVDLHYNQVGLWRARYDEFGLAGLEDEERRGRPCMYDHDDVLLLVKTVTEPPPEGATRWNDGSAGRGHGRPRRAHLGIPGVRICKALDLKPWQVESWRTSHDPHFWEGAGDVCGLYLNPPENAVVWSVDEKSGMQAKSRINPIGPAIPGMPCVESSSTAATAPRCCSPGSRCTRARLRAGSRTNRERVVCPLLTPLTRRRPVASAP